MLNVPAGSNTGTSLRLKGRGLLDRKSGQRGDQYVKLKVVLPDAPDNKLREFLEGWRRVAPTIRGKEMEQFATTTLDELLRQHGQLKAVHVERWVARGLLRPAGRGRWLELRADRRRAPACWASWSTSWASTTSPSTRW